jgi:hypothetical protein
MSVRTETLIFALGNNIRTEGDLFRRVVKIVVEPSGQKDNFKHNLPTDAIRIHPEIVRALLVLILWWVQLGKPRVQGHLKASFEGWHGIVGGVLEAAGVLGFLAGDSEAEAEFDDEGREFRDFLDVWFERFGSRPVRPVQLLRLALDEGLLLVTLPHTTARGQETALGRLLRRHAGMRFGRYLLHRIDSSHRSMCRLTAVEENGPEVCDVCDVCDG